MDPPYKPPVFGNSGVKDNYPIDLNELFSDYFLNFDDIPDEKNEEMDFNEVEINSKSFRGNDLDCNHRDTNVFTDDMMYDDADIESRKRKASESDFASFAEMDSCDKNGTFLTEQQKIERRIVKEHMPDMANSVLERSASERAVILSGSDRPLTGSQILPSIPRKPNCLLVGPDFQLVSALIDSQQNFTLSDPSLPDNPIVYASQGFLNLTGYTIDKVIGRNCRFLQGPGTDPRSVDIIRRGVSEGRDTSVCLLNYKADGTPFWNQFFVAALRDEQDKIVNYVGVQAMVKQSPIDDFKDKLKKIPLPDHLMSS